MLALLTVVLLVRLRSTPEEPPSAPQAVTELPDSDSQPPPPPRLPPPLREPKVTRLPVPAKRLPAPPARDAAVPAREPPGRPAAPAVIAREPLGVHTAPAAVPTEIQQETDPVRRAQLQRMHALAVSRSRASRFRRRLRQLNKALELARKEGNWSADRIQRTEQDIEQLKAAIVEAERRVGDAEKAAAGDKDK